MIHLHVRFWASVSKCFLKHYYNIPTVIKTKQKYVYSIWFFSDNSPRPSSIKLVIRLSINLKLNYLVCSCVSVQQRSGLIFINQRCLVFVTYTVPHLAAWALWSSCKTSILTGGVSFIQSVFTHRTAADWVLCNVLLLHDKLRESSHIQDTWTGEFGSTSAPIRPEDLNGG